MNIGSSEWKERITSGAKQLGIDITDYHAGLFAIHALELLKWNQNINLTAITDAEEIAIKHFTDSVAPAKMIPDHARLLDIGSGGGFPGIVLKVIKPSLEVTLIDASRKKVSFQKQVIRTLNLKKIDAHHVRAEDFAKTANRFDIVICRAFSALDTFVFMAIPFLVEHGAIIAMKGKISESEIAAVEKLAIPLNVKLSIEKYILPFSDADRAILKLSF
jgi:16S rRNA (guanine527-N7)-methyltransferase